MRIDNNLGAMVGAGLQLQESAANIADIANMMGDPGLQEVTSDLVSEIAGQIPEIIAYSANAKSIELQSATLERLLDIKA